MTQEEVKRVKAWLYSIKKTEMTRVNLRQALADLDTRMASPPTWTHVPDIVTASGGTTDSKQESWAIFCEEYPTRRSYLEDEIAKNEEKLRLYYQTIGALVNESKLGSMAAEIIKYKYYERVKPDNAIYAVFLYCSPETFYRAHRLGLHFFFDVLPHVFFNPQKIDSFVTVNQAKSVVS